MENTTMDVNTAPVESSTTGAEQNTQGNVSQEQSLAEALNTEQAQGEQQSKYVPYDRFQEVIKAKQELEAKFESDAYKDYQKWDNVIREDPNVAAYVKEAITNYYNQIQQQQVAQQMQIDPNNPLSLVVPYIQAHENQINYLVQQQQRATYQQYEADFNNSLSKANVPEQSKQLYRSLIEADIRANAPSALNKYDASILSNAFSRVHKQIQAAQRANTTSYIQDKAKDGLPPSNSGTGATPRVVSGDNTPESRRAELLNLLMS